MLKVTNSSRSWIGAPTKIEKVVNRWDMGKKTVNKECRMKSWS